MRAHAGSALIDPRAVMTKAALTSGMRVADFGCGRTGHVLFQAAEVVGEHGVVYAIDILKDALENIKSQARINGVHNIETVWSDIEREGKTPIPASSLQACLFVNVLHLLQNKNGALKEAMRLLAPGGKIVVVDWNQTIGGFGPEAKAMLLPEQVQKIAHDNGLKTKEEVQLNDHHYCMIFEK